MLFAGTPEQALPSLEMLLQSTHEVVGVLTRPDARAGRGRHLSPSPVAQLARAHGLEVLTPQRPREPQFIERLTSLAPQCCPVVAYGGLIPPAALAIPQYGWVNLHFSLLPAWRGAAPVQHAVLRGDDVTGATTFQLAEGLDTGPIYGMITEKIQPTDTAGDLLHRLATAGATLLLSTLDGIESGQLRPQPQPDEGVSLAPKLTADDARVNWSDPALIIDRHIRACTPAPGAWTTYRGERLKLGPLSGSMIKSYVAGDQRVDRGTAPLLPGELQVEKYRVHVGTATSPVELGVVQAQGKRPMSAVEWARGARPAHHDKFS